MPHLPKPLAICGIDGLTEYVIRNKGLSSRSSKMRVNSVTNE
jgi:hypothetical protein